MSWHSATIGDLVILQRGHDLTESDRKLGDVPVVGAAGPNGFHNQSKAKGPGVTIGRSGGSIGKVTYVPCDYWPHNTCLYVKDFKGNNPRFVAYLLSTMNLAQLNSGAAQPSLNRNFVYPVRIKLPDLREQVRIASILSAYDDLIENNRRRIHLLEQAARLLYKEWFVYLRFPGHEHVKVVDGVPEGWEKGCVGDLAEVKSGYAFKSKDWLAEGNPVIKIKNIVGDNTVDAENCQCVDNNVAEKASRFALEEGNLLIAMTGATVGKVGIMPKTSKTCYLNQRVGLFKSKAAFDVMPFLLSFFNTDYAQTQITNFAAGAAQPNISGGQIELIELLIPNKSLLQLYLESVYPSFDQRLVLLQQNQKLKRARDLLLPKLMNGDIAV